MVYTFAKEHTAPVSKVAVNKDGSMIASAADKETRLWALEEDRQTSLKLFTSGEVHDIAWSSDWPSTLACVSQKPFNDDISMLQLYDLRDSKRASMQLADAHNCAWLDDFCVAVSFGFRSTHISVYDLRYTGRYCEQVDAHVRAINCLVQSPKRCVASCSVDNTVRTWSLADGSLTLEHMIPFTSNAICAAWADDELAVITADRCARMMRLQDNGAKEKRLFTAYDVDGRFATHVAWACGAVGVVFSDGFAGMWNVNDTLNRKRSKESVASLRKNPLFSYPGFSASCLDMHPIDGRMIFGTKTSFVCVG